MGVQGSGGFEFRVQGLGLGVDLGGFWAPLLSRRAQRHRRAHRFLQPLIPLAFGSRKKREQVTKWV